MTTIESKETTIEGETKDLNKPAVRKVCPLCGLVHGSREEFRSYFDSLFNRYTTYPGRVATVDSVAVVKKDIKFRVVKVREQNGKITYKVVDKKQTNGVPPKQQALAHY